MNTLIQIISIAIVTTVLSVLVKQYKTELAMCISIAGGVMILLMIMPSIQDAITTVRSISSAGGIDNEYVSLIIRVIAIAYVTELGAGIARDAGEGALATKVELSGKIVIFSLCIPTLVNLIETVTYLIV